MDRLRIARSVRAIRIRKGWTQQELADAAAVSRTFVSDIERALTRHGDLARLERICHALGADLDVRVRWRGEGLDRLLDESHADLVERMVGRLRGLDWEVALEVTFNDFGDRGSIDVLAWHRATRSLLVVEVKPVIGDAQATLMPLDRKARLGPKIGRARGWDPASVSRLLAVWDGTMNRRRVGRLGDSFGAAFPTRGWALQAWLRNPSGPISGLELLPDSARGGVRRRATGRLRVNKPRSRTSAPQ